ncbi:hypothetical protein GCM10023328_02900 [Modestobacter marinus]|uniref:Lysylphosphatidylglycerol synthetase-like protein (DUF2156 family) n=1 Tax=Modestobacter marinus TaxID=477641 RepID=A0A846LI03_9ACTN|nr:hypothetical protein [Modestobacter marinus]NIH67286.1 lysylphosphatidylglycerol synthetase-like protein (DUF2156 family) [Modestobacter marinus]GGL53556.1 hypothetical protein GCM10011589_07060 [Modestobacter marinus]
MPARPSSSGPLDPAQPRPGMPPSARVAVGLLVGLALLLLLNALLTSLTREAVVDALAAAQPDSPRSDAERVVLANLVQAVVFGGLAAVSAAGLARRHGWARWSGLATTAGLGVLTLVATLLAGGVAVSTLLVLVLCAAAVTSLAARTTAAWTSSGPRSRATR